MKKTDFNTKVNEIEKTLTDHDHDNYITTQKFNKFKNLKFCFKVSTSKFRKQN